LKAIPYSWKIFIKASIAGLVYGFDADIYIYIFLFWIMIMSCFCYSIFWKTNKKFPIDKIYCLGVGIIPVALSAISDDFANQQKWVQTDIAFIEIVASLLGIIIDSWMIDRFGSKRTLQNVDVLYILGSITTVVAWSPSIIAMPRFMSGIGVGMLTIAPQLYIAKISYETQGPKIAVNCLLITVGHLLSFIVNMLVSSNLEVLFLLDSLNFIG
jgi:MFS family permease